MSDNVIQFPYKMRRTDKPVPRVCELAAEQFEQIIVLGTSKEDKMVQMITTMTVLLTMVIMLIVEKEKK